MMLLLNTRGSTWYSPAPTAAESWRILAAWASEITCAPLSTLPRDDNEIWSSSRRFPPFEAEPFEAELGPSEGLAGAGSEARPSPEKPPLPESFTCIWFDGYFPSEGYIGES